MLNKLSACLLTLLTLGLLLGASGNAHAAYTEGQVKRAVDSCYVWARSPFVLNPNDPNLTACKFALSTLAENAEPNDLAQDTQLIYNAARAMNYPGAAMALQPVMFELVILPWEAAAACITAGGQVGAVCAPPSP